MWPGHIEDWIFAAMRVKYATTFLMLSLASAYAASSAPFVVRALSAYATISLALVGCAYALNQPRLLLKSPCGKISILGRVLYFPYHALSHVALFVQSHLSKDEPFSWISESVLLGRVPLKADRGTLGEYGVRSVLDLTAEFGAACHVRELSYLSLPLLDGLAPSAEQIRSCVAWMKKQLDVGPLLVHCALGHGRSATVAAAFLASEQNISSASDVVSSIAAVRPGIGLNHPQRSTLEKYMMWRIEEGRRQ